ncbi:MAG: hypothetical protein DMF99_29270 [Acidobacteria bacterium]|nr:MAG: hypothetical protein DMF99_29270 [Acidobacteriota bacterium]
MLERDARRCRHLLQVWNRAAGSRQTPGRPIRTDSGTAASCLMTNGQSRCITLAFRIAYGVLRRREDPEDVAQDAFAKAYRSFRQLRDRDRFRAWLVRMTWRLALDRQRSDRRRATRETIHATKAPTMTTTDHVIEHERAQRLWEAIDACRKSCASSSSSPELKNTI